MTERAAILSRLTDLRVELADARLALDRCPANERASIANRIVIIQAEIVRGEDLAAKTAIALPAKAASEIAPPGQSRTTQPAPASLLSTWKEGSR